MKAEIPSPASANKIAVDKRAQAVSESANMFEESARLNPFLKFGNMVSGEIKETKTYKTVSNIVDKTGGVIENVGKTAENIAAGAENLTSGLKNLSQDVEDSLKVFSDNASKVGTAVVIGGGAFVAAYAYSVLAKNKST